jgi:hypothetical protein
MKDEFFDHIKHRLAETAVPDPEQAWQQMNVLLDTERVPHKTSVRSLHWWQAAACVLVVSAAWAMYHEWSSPIHRQQAANIHLPLRSGSKALSPGTDSSNQLLINEVPAHQDRNNQDQTDEAQGYPAPGKHQGAAGHAFSPFVPSPFGGFAGNQPGMAAIAGSPVSQQRKPGITDNLEDNLEEASTSYNDHFTALSISRTDETFLLDKPVAGPLASDRQQNVAGGAPGLLHLQNSQHLPRWSFSIGLGANAPGSFRKNKSTGHASWDPGVYPIATVEYRLSPRWSIAAGVAAPAPVAYSNMPTHTVLYIAADSLQNNTQTTASQRLARLTYLDIPLTAEYRVLRHLTLEAGFQLSTLLSKEEETMTKNTPVRGFIAPYATTNVYYPGSPPIAQAEVTKIDPRYLLGLNYTFHRFSAELQYQAGIHNAVTQTDDLGSSVGDRTSIMRMQIGYRLN